MTKRKDNDNTSFFGRLEFVMVSVCLLWDENLTATERLLLGTILGLHFHTGYGCYASNSYLGKVLNLSNSRTSALLTKLKRLGYIEINFIRDQFSGKVCKRYITPLKYDIYYENWALD